MSFVNEQGRQIDTIQASSNLSKQTWRLTLSIVEHCGPTHEKLVVTIAEEWGVRDQIPFFGWIDSARGICSQFDLLVAPSLAELIGSG